jgi:hypothetical protein
MNLISNPQEVKELQGALQEISDAMLRMDAEKELIKEIKSTVIENHKDKLTMKQLNKVVKAFYKDNFNTEVQEHQEFEVLYETITKQKSHE